MARSMLLAFALSLLAGCASLPALPSPAGADDVEWPRGVHPYPRGDEWPAGLEGPFEARPAERVSITAADGVVLRGYLWRPDVPSGVRVPVVLVSTPYGVEPEWRAEGSIPYERLVREGFAVAAFDVRGTGASGGCFEWHGPLERADQALLVERLAAMPWSNGRVGMLGISYLAATTVMAAIEAPPALKTIVVSGLVTDGYTFVHTPQGAAWEGAASFIGRFSTRAGVMSRDPSAAPEAACPEIMRPATVIELGMRTDARDAAFWETRRYLPHLPKVTAAVLLGHGFQDLYGSGHAWEEDEVWRALVRAPKAQLEGQWGHAFPGGSAREKGMPDWEDRLVSWLAFWLQGKGSPPAALGRVDYEDDAGTWRSSGAWPPAEARAEALHLVEGVLSGSAEGAPGRFVAEGDETWPEGPACGDVVTGLAFVSEPLARGAVVAGNPFALLRIRTDAPGGIVATELLRLAPDARCEGGRWIGAELLTWGAADLRFHAGNMQGRDFPVGAWTDVRVDMPSLAAAFEPGARIALVVGGGAGDRASQPFFPRVEVDPASHVLLPFVEGGTGGAPAWMRYPPRPFAPAVSA